MEKNIDLKLMPNELYWESIFSCFFKLKKLADYFTELNRTLTEEENPISKLFFDYFNRQKTIEECPEALKKILILKKREDLFSEPTALFDYLIEELHNELKSLDNNNKININNENENKCIKSYRDENTAMEKFYEYEKNNKSIIQKLFFGRKKITKYCESCGEISYKIEFLKFCPFNLKGINDSVTIENLYENIQREFEKEYYCNSCEKNQKFKIKISIESNPEILIFLFFNLSEKLNIDFGKDFTESNINYRVKSLVMGTDNSYTCLCKIFCCKNKDDKVFVSYGYDKGKYYKFEKGDIKYINNKELLKGNPYIIFYQIKKEKEVNNNNEIIKTEGSDLGSNDYLFKKYNNDSKSKNKNEIIPKIEKESNIVSLSYNSNNNIKDKKYMNYINSGIQDIQDNKNIINISKKKIKNISLISNNFNNKLNKSISSIISSKNSDLDQEDKLIRLYFKFNDGNIIFIDVENNITFEDIITELKAEYDWIKVDGDNFYFNDKKIDKNQIPKNLGINQGDYIDVYSNLIDE